jgi:hypothetical protein
MSRTVVIHQPEYFPWLGFLDKARQADVLVLLDSVQFDRSSLQHRAKIVGANGPLWLTMPYVHRFPQRIDEVELAADRWSVKHQKSVQACYGRAPRLQAGGASARASVLVGAQAARRRHRPFLRAVARRLRRSPEGALAVERAGREG